jgi:2-oxoglutarate dehydrogenase E1 component
VIPDGTDRNASAVRRVLLCTGKVYYELDEFRQKYERDDVAIIRVEELYPFPEEPLRQALTRYRDDVEVVWVQEEPENMGAWRYLFCITGGKLLGRYPVRGVSRPASASPATGSLASHSFEQEMLLAEAFREQFRQ